MDFHWMHACVHSVAWVSCQHFSTLWSLTANRYCDTAPSVCINTYTATKFTLSTESKHIAHDAATELIFNATKKWMREKKTNLVHRQRNTFSKSQEKSHSCGIHLTYDKNKYKRTPCQDTNASASADVCVHYWCVLHHAHTGRHMKRTDTWMVALVCMGTKCFNNSGFNTNERSTHLYPDYYYYYYTCTAHSTCRTKLRLEHWVKWERTTIITLLGNSVEVLAFSDSLCFVFIHAIPSSGFLYFALF